MKQPLILLCAIILIFALSCSKTEPPPPELPPGVAMVAWDENTEEDLAGYIVHLSSDQIYIDGLKELRMVGDRVVNYSVSVFDDNGVEQINTKLDSHGGHPAGHFILNGSRSDHLHQHFVC